MNKETVRKALIWAAVGVILGSVVTFILVTNSIYDMFGYNQTPYGMQEQYQECLSQAPANGDCIFIAVVVPKEALQ